MLSQATALLARSGLAQVCGICQRCACWVQAVLEVETGLSAAQQMLVHNGRELQDGCGGLGRLGMAAQGLGRAGLLVRGWARLGWVL